MTIFVDYWTLFCCFTWKLRTFKTQRNIFSKSTCRYFTELIVFRNTSNTSVWACSRDHSGTFFTRDSAYANLQGLSFSNFTIAIQRLKHLCTNLCNKRRSRRRILLCNDSVYKLVDLAVFAFFIVFLVALFAYHPIQFLNFPAHSSFSSKIGEYRLYIPYSVFGIFLQTLA